MTEKAPRYDDGIAPDGSDAKFIRRRKDTLPARAAPPEQWVPPVAAPGAFERPAEEYTDPNDATLHRSQVLELKAKLDALSEGEGGFGLPVTDALNAVEEAYNAAAQRVVGAAEATPQQEVEQGKSAREQAENAAHAAREQLSDDEATAVWWYAVEFNRLQTADPKDYRAQNNIIARMSELKAKIGTADGKRVASMYEAAYSIK